MGCLVRKWFPPSRRMVINAEPTNNDGLGISLGTDVGSIS